MTTKNRVVIGLSWKVCLLKEQRTEQGGIEDEISSPLAARC